MRTVERPVPVVGAAWEETSLRDLYRDERWSLVRLATLLLRDQAEAEEVVQDAFVHAHLAWGRLRDADRSVAYLRSAVMNGARSRLRHRKVVARFDRSTARSGSDSTFGPGSAYDRSPEAAAVANDDRAHVLAALATLPGRQRECLVLRYYLDLSEAEIAATLGISPGSVKTHTSRGTAALATRLEVDR